MIDVASPTTRLLFTALVVLIALQRLAELARSRRNERWLRRHGGNEHGSGHYRFMVSLHATFLLSCVAEVWLLPRPLYPILTAVALLLLGAATGLRIWAISTLGRRWTTRVIALPGAPHVAAGPYRYLSHPNYLAVVTEILALPLVHTAWLTAAAFSLANGVLLAVRIRVEEKALGRRT